MDTRVVLCTVPDAETGARLARSLVEQKLGACVNIVPSVRSIYRYQGEVCDDAESLLVIKTAAHRFCALRDWLSEHHPYDVPEIIALPIEDGAPAYLKWLAEQCMPEP